MTNRQKIKYISDHTDTITAMREMIAACTDFYIACNDVIDTLLWNQTMPVGKSEAKSMYEQNMLVKNAITEMLVKAAVLAQKGYYHDVDIADTIIGQWYDRIRLDGEGNADCEI